MNPPDRIDVNRELLRQLKRIADCLVGEYGPGVIQDASPAPLTVTEEDVEAIMRVLDENRKWLTVKHVVRAALDEYIKRKKGGGE